MPSLTTASQRGVRQTVEPEVHLTKVWSDKHVEEFTIEVCDGVSVFSSKAYVGKDFVENLISDLAGFRNHIYGGLYDFKLGEFGPEYAGGAFHARLNFQKARQALRLYTLSV
ncbi:MAG: hypothetical protein F6K00_05095 [Leptolyngbya sp. SIOISBB]|nr:hypothetical protein [Leptolyngbya sp. SIOISBB]